MGLITKLKSLLGFDDGRSRPRRGGGSVTVERERGRDASEAADSEPETLSESAGAGEEGTAAEPAEAAGPDDAAGQPERTEGTEPEDEPVIEQAEPDDGIEDEELADELAEPETEAEIGESGAGSGSETAGAAGEEPEPEPEIKQEPATEIENDVGAESTVEDDAEPEPEIGEETEPEPVIGEEPEAEVEEEPEPSGAALDDIKGIGPAYAQRLRDAGVESVEQLADADAAELADEIEVSEKRVSAWIDRAQSR